LPCNGCKHQLRMLSWLPAYLVQRSSFEAAPVCVDSSQQ